jgi:quinol monooxygenase YgiN
MNAWRAFAFAAIMMTAGATAAQAQEPGPVSVVTYVEVREDAKNQAAALLESLRDAARQGDGNLAADVVESLGRRGHFVLLTTWKDQKSFDAHMAAAPTKEAREKLQAVRNSPADDRIHNNLSVGAAQTAGKGKPVYVVTHVDVPPPRKDECVAMLKKLADASRQDSGNLRFDVVQQTSRPNHFTVIEVWRNRKAFDSHVTAAHTRDFRDQLTPMSGALYDERLYKTLK